MNTYKNKTILSYPRSGTKLLSKIYQQQGYHNFGEFFNTFSCGIDNSQDLPTSVRLSRDHQSNIRDDRPTRGGYVNDWTHILVTNHRLQQFKKYADITPSIVTVWPMTFELVPESVSHLIDQREVLCLRRKNRFDQLLSRCITVKNLNHDEEIASKPIKVEKGYFEYVFLSLLRLERIQDNLIAEGKGRLVDFDDLVTGHANLGFEYTVTTKDQHSNLTSLISNLAETIDFYTELQKRYGVKHETY